MSTDAHGREKVDVIAEAETRMGRRRERERENLPFLHLFDLFGSSVDWLVLTSIGDADRSSLLSLPM